MNITCKNCNQHFKGNYCNNCGQAASTGRLNFDSIWEDIKYGLFHFNHKIVFTTRQLFYRPGHAIRDYIEGKRLDYFKPISFLLLLASVYALLNHYFHIQFIMEGSSDHSVFNRLGLEESNEWIINHFGWLALLGVPIYSVVTFFIFRKQGYNFIEHLVTTSFLAAQRYLFLIAVFPVLYYVGTGPYRRLYGWVTLFIEFLLMMWVYLQFFKDLPKGKTFLLLLASYVLIMLITLLVLVLLLLGAQAYFN